MFPDVFMVVYTTTNKCYRVEKLKDDLWQIGGTMWDSDGITLGLVSGKFKIFELF